MSDQNPSRPDTTLLGPSGTQRMSNVKPRLPEPIPALSDVVVKAFLIREHTAQGQQSRIPLEQSRTVVGREDSDVLVDDQTVSSQHFAIECADNGQFSVQDLGSSNGTALNGTEVRTSFLVSGDRIQAGKTGFIFRTIQTIPWNQDS
jgi:pSer/pThr/pTyr-binding forkhead associated (FHA) protein